MAAQNKLHDFSPLLGASGFQILIGEGVAVVNNVPIVIPATNLTLIALSTNYVYVDLSAGVISSNTSGFTSTEYPVAIVTTDSISILSLQDVRSGAPSTSIGGGGSGIPLGTSAQVPVMNSGATAYAPVSLSGDLTITSAGVVTVTKSSGTAFGTGAFATIANYALLAGATFTGEVITPASVSGSAGLNIPPGVAPASPNNGDCWTTNSGLFCYINGTIVGPYSATTGFSNPMTTLGDEIYGGAAGAATRLAGPTAVNNVAQVLTETPASGLAVSPVWSPLGVATRASTCGSNVDTVLATDRAGYVSWSDASACAVTLPAAGGTGFANNFVFVGCDIGAGTATITPTTSTISYTTGSAYTSAAPSLALTTGQCAWTYSDNTNYFAIVRGAGGGSGTINAAAQYDIPYYSASGSATTISGAALSGFQFDSTSGPPTAVQLSAINPQTATYQVLASDFSSYKTITVASGTFTIQGRSPIRPLISTDPASLSSLAASTNGSSR